MAIDQLTQTISTIPEAGHRGIDVQTAFVIKQEDFQDHLQGITVAELNTLKTQINTTVSGMNDAVTTINTKANEVSANTLSASTSANTATTKASEATTSASSSNAYSLKAGKWADNDYNVEVETGKYSAKHWSVVAQNTVNNKVNKITSTDNAIVRFDGVTGDVQNSGVTIDDSNNISIAGSSSGINGGAFVLVKNGATSNIGIGNYSALNGGSYDSTPTLWCQGGLNITDNTTSRIKIDSAGNVGIGASPSTWRSTSKAMNIGASGGVESLTNNGSYISVNANNYNNGTNDIYINTATATKYQQTSGIHSWFTASPGTAGNAITWTQAMTLDANGSLKIQSPISSGVGAKFSLSSSLGAWSFETLSGRHLSLKNDYAGTEVARLTNSGDLLLQSGTGGLGYGTGSGGTVTQLTSKSTAVTLNKPNGTITTANTALAAGASVQFIVNCSAITSIYDTVYVAQENASVVNTGNYEIRMAGVYSNSFIISIKNVTAGTLSEAIPIKFAIIKGAIA